MASGQDRRGTGRLSGPMALAAIAALLTMSGIALAALEQQTSGPHPVVVRRRISSPAARSAVSPPVVAPLFGQAGAAQPSRLCGTPAGNTSPPTISGTAVQGGLVAEVHGAWSSNPTSYGYQWARCSSTGGSCQNLAQANAQSYSLGPSDVGSTIRVYESASNGRGE